MKNIGFIIMGAGLGTRMKSSVSKVMHTVANLPMVNHVVNSITPLNPKTGVVVVGNHNADVVATAVPNAQTVLQDTPNGTATAVGVCGDTFAGFDGEIVILNGDTPLIQTESISHLIDVKNETGAEIAIMGFLAQDPTGYGRIMVAEDDDFVDAIIEHRECDDEQLAVNLCYSGIMVADSKVLFDLIAKVDNNNAKGEYYLTDIIKIAKANGQKISFSIAEETEVMGCDSKTDLAVAESVYQFNKRMDAMENGVQLINPETVYFSYDTEISPDVIIEPNVFFGTGVKIESGTNIRAFSHLEQCSVGENCVIGPFARIRPDTELLGDNKVGNFVEIKKSTIGAGSKINHLSYIGDTTMGENTNIGAGTITCNYDGYDKHQTQIGDNVFVGSNTAIVAPVKLGDGSIVGAGSTITKDVNKDDLAVARGKQTNLENQAKKFRDSKKKK